MFIPPRDVIDQFKNQENNEEGAKIQSMHLVISKNIADELFKDVQSVYVNYISDVKKIFVVPSDDLVFKKMHDPLQLLLKDKNISGEKSIALHELIIDHELDDTDRIVNLEIRLSKRMLVIQL